MKLVQQLKIFTSETVGDLETQFNGWYRDLATCHLQVPALRATPVVIHEKVLTVDRTKNNTLYVLGVFYDHYDLEATEKGEDRGGRVGGVSVFGR